MQLDDMRMLGDPLLYEVCAPVQKEELVQVKEWARGLDSVILEVQRKFGFGRAIAAPQMGIPKRLVCMHIDQAIIMINPELFDMSEEMFELWDDCMSFPNLLVWVRRHKSCKLRFRDIEWKEHIWDLEGDMSELMQHEVDHLDGILATERVTGSHGFKWRR
jgi:peptide deformylase